MKSGKTDKSLYFLRLALKNLPQDNSLSEARHHLSLAVDRIENVDRKRQRREEASQTPATVPFVVGGHTPGSLELIDRMIGEEQKKLVLPSKAQSLPLKKLDGELPTLFD